MKKKNKQLAVRNKIVDTILGGKIKLPKTKDTKKPKTAKDDPRYTKMKNDKELALLNPGTTDKKVGEIMLSTKTTKEQKDAIIAQWLFENGKESSSFLAELFMSKGKLTKETRVFKNQMRFDFEMFADLIVILLNDISDTIIKDMRNKTTLSDSYVNMANAMKQGADKIVDRMHKVTEERMAEKGYGIYLDNAGRPYSILDKDVDEVINKDREDLKKKKENE